MARFNVFVRALLAILLVTFQHAHIVAADVPPSGYCVDACSVALNSATFVTAPGSPKPLEDYYGAHCSNVLITKSLYYCSAIHCNAHQIKAGLNFENTTCKQYALNGATLPSFESIMASVTQEQLNAVERISVLNVSTDPYDHAVVPSIDFYQAGYDTTASFAGNIIMSWNFSWALYGFWGLVLLIGIVNRGVEFIKDRSSQSNLSKTSQSTPSSWSRWFRRKFVLPATFGERCQEPTGWCTLPPRLESILLTIFIVMNIVFCFPGYHVFLGNLYYAKTSLQLSRYISDRTGILSIANLPLLWIFSARNDPFLWLTGWSFATYNRFHRWIARIATVQAIVHSIGYSVFSYIEGNGNFKESWTEEYWYCGGIATMVMSLMLVASIYPLRQYYYDLFLMLHIGFAVIFLVTMYYHVKIFKGQYNGFLWPCVAMWALDRLIRIIRVVVVSILPRLKGVKAVSTYNPSTDMIRMDLTDFFADKPPTPGHFYYLYEGAALRGYESHPFTLCTWRVNDSVSSRSESEAGDSLEDKDGGRVVISDRTATGELRHTFLIRPYAGYTGRLQQRLTSSKETDSCQTTVLLEGPYGEPMNLQAHSDVLIFAGGSGITAAISQSYALLSSNRLQSIHIVWAVRQIHLVDDICANELSAALDDPRVSMDVYLTSVSPLNNTTASVSPSKYAIRTGRPDMDADIANARTDCNVSLGVVCCGVPCMADACRAAVVRALGQMGPDVEFYNETSGW